MFFIRHESTAVAVLCHDIARPQESVIVLLAVPTKAAITQSGLVGQS